MVSSLLGKQVGRFRRSGSIPSSSAIGRHCPWWASGLESHRHALAWGLPARAFGVLGTLCSALQFFAERVAAVLVCGLPVRFLCLPPMEGTANGWQLASNTRGTSRCEVRFLCPPPTLEGEVGMVPTPGC
jgi:hypothetical protein